MRRLQFKKAAVAAAVAILVAAGGVSAYAATQNQSLLSLFTGKSRENAEDLLDTDVKQSEGTNKEQSRLATFKIREAICDKNQVWVQVAVSPADAQKYLLVPMASGPENSVDDLGLAGLSGTQTIGEYAKSLGKKCVLVLAGIAGDEAPAQTISQHMEEDGTLVFTIEFRNDKKDSRLDYVCETQALPAEDTSGVDAIKDTIRFTLKDNADIKTAEYLPATTEKVPGTDLVVDSVTFSTSDLGILCDVAYHYAGESKDWYNTKDNDICFYMLDANGEILQSGGGGSTEEDGNCVQSWQYPLQELPDTITFQAKDVMESTLYGTVDVKLAK